MATKIKVLFLKVRIYVFLLGAVALNVLMINVDSFFSSDFAVYAVIVLVVLVDLAFIGFVISRIVVRRRQNIQLQNDNVESDEGISLSDDDVSLEDSLEYSQEELLALGGNHYKQDLQGFKTVPEQFIDKSNFNTPENLYEYVNELSMFLLSKGIEVSKNCIREMLASLAASKVIHFTHKDIEVANKTIEALFEFIGFECLKHDGSKDSDNANSLFQQESDFYRFLLYADSHRSRLQVLTVNNINLNRIEECYKPIVKYSVDPLLPVSFHQDLKKGFTVSRNMWFVFTSSIKEDNVYSKDFAEGVITITLDSDLIGNDTPQNVQKGKMTYEMFRDLLEDSYEEFYMDESFWKKVDELENYFKKYTTFNIDNRLFRQIERFASIFIAFGGEKVDVIDAIMLNKLNQLFALLDYSELIRLKQDVLIEIDKIFGLEKLYRSKPVLKEILETHNDVS